MIYRNSLLRRRIGLAPQSLEPPYRETRSAPRQAPPTIQGSATKMVTRYQRLAELPMKAPQPSGQLLELWCEDQRGTYVIPYSATGSRVDGVQSSPGSKFRRKSSVGGRVPSAALASPDVAAPT